MQCHNYTSDVYNKPNRLKIGENWASNYLQSTCTTTNTMLWVSELTVARWPPCLDSAVRHLVFIYIYVSIYQSFSISIYRCIDASIYLIYRHIQSGEGHQPIGSLPCHAPTNQNPLQCGSDPSPRPIREPAACGPVSLFNLPEGHLQPAPRCNWQRRPQLKRRGSNTDGNMSFLTFSRLAPKLLSSKVRAGPGGSTPPSPACQVLYPSS